MILHSTWSRLAPRNVICRWRWIAVWVVVMAAASALVSQTVVRPNRITQEATSGGMVTMAGTVHPLTRRATDLGEVNSEMAMSLTMNISLSAAQKTQLEALLAAQQDPNSPQYHQWLTPEEYGAQFGLTDADLSQVTGWLASQGFTVTGVSKTRDAIHFSAQAWQVESAFHTQVHQYQWNGTTHFANMSDLQVPAGLAGVVLGVRGLNNFRLQPHVRGQVAPDFTINLQNGGLTNFLTPADWATIYDVTRIYNAGYDGTGAYVGVVGQTYVPETDISNFRSAAGLSAAKISYVCISSKDCSDSAGTGPASATGGDLMESDLDIEWSGGIAKNATVVFVYAAYDDNSNDVISALEYAVNYKNPATNKVLPVIAMSYGGCENSRSASDTLNQLGMTANSLGETLLVSSGDSGAAGCDDAFGASTATKGLYVDVPANSPYFTGVGGTTLSGDESNTSTYWNQNEQDVVGNALQYIPETTWNDTSSANGLAASGGGVSTYYSQLSWQNGLISGQTMRMVPDVSFSASLDHDGYMICTPDSQASKDGASCTSGFFSSQGYFFDAGGTSASVQVFAGLLTLLEQAESAKIGGNINPTLYGLAKTNPSVFHDIKTGNNIVPCTVGASDPGCSGGTMGYSALTGYDMATGLGSIDGYALYTALGGTSLATTSTSVSASVNPVTVNGTTTLTAMVSSTTAGTITGNVTFTVGTTTLGTMGLTSGEAQLPVAATTANGFVTGGNTVKASYGGDANYAASSNTTTLTVTALPAATTSVTATPNSIALGSSTATESFTATVTGSSGTPAGTVQFKVGSVAVGPAVTLDGTGKATLSGVVPSTANGFSTNGSTADTITATYTPSGTYAGSSGTSSVTVTSPAYTITPTSTSVSLSPGGSTTPPITVALNSTTFAGPTTLTATSSSALITATLTSSSVTLTAGSNGSTTVNISASSSAAKHAPALPWTGGMMAFGAVLAGLPLARRKRRVAAVLLAAVGIAGLGFMMSCGGSKSSTSGPQAFTVTISGTGGISSVINVSVQ